MHIKSDHDFLFGKCDYYEKYKLDMRKHVEINHWVKYKNCSDNFAGIDKLNNHMWRVHVRNPSYGNYYMKDWFIRNHCIRIFSEQSRKEIGTLHSDLYIESNPCSSLPSGYKILLDLYMKTVDGILSLYAGWRSEVDYFKTCSDRLNMIRRLEYLSIYIVQNIS